MAGPLTGVRVLEFSQVIAAPLAGQFLVDLGADVLKVEPPEGESWRLQGSFAPQESKSFQTLNRGKRDLTLRLDEPAAQAIVHALVPSMDVVLINYRPDVPARFHIDYETLRALRPDLVYADLTAFGRRGPWAMRPGYDGVVQAVSGLLAGEAKLRPDGSPATIATTAIADYCTGMVMADAIVTALIHRARTGEGQQVECSLLATALNLQGVDVMEHPRADGERDAAAARRRALQAEGVPYDELVALRQRTRWPSPDLFQRCYLVRDGAIAVDAFDRARRDAARRLWAVQACVAGDPGYQRDDEGDDEGEGVRAAVDVARVEARYAAMSEAEALAELAARGIPAARVAFGEEMGADPQAIAEGLFTALVHPGTGPQATVSHLLRFRGCKLDPLRPSPTVGSDTDAVLRALGHSDAGIAELRAQGVIA